VPSAEHATLEEALGEGEVKEIKTTKTNKTGDKKDIKNC
jgi:hypothetical protein